MIDWNRLLNELEEDNPDWSVMVSILVTEEQQN